MRKNIILILVFSMFLCLSFASKISIIDGASEFQINLDSTNTELNYTPGAIIIIELESNPTTGYEWNLVKNSDQNLILTVDNFFIQNNENKKLSGVGGIQKYIIQTSAESGENNLIFEYKREWEKEENPNQFQIKLIGEMSKAILPIYNLEGSFDDDSGKIELEWEYTDSYDYFKIYRKVDVGDYYFKFINISSDKTFTDGPVAHPGSRHYGVSVVSDGIESDIEIIQVNVE